MDPTAAERARRYRERRRARKMTINLVVGVDFYEAAAWSGWITHEDMADKQVLAEKLGLAVDFLIGTEEPDED